MVFVGGCRLGRILLRAIESAEVSASNRVTARDGLMSRVDQSVTVWPESRDKWAKIWFEKLSRFHGRKPQATWEFTADEVIAFLRDHLRRKTPAWKRLKIIESLICYRRYVQSAPFDDLTFIRVKLEELARTEQITAAKALLYLFQHVLKREMGEVNAIRSSKGKQIPSVLSIEKIERIHSHLRSVHLPMAKLLYGCSVTRISRRLGSTCIHSIVKT